MTKKCAYGLQEKFEIRGEIVLPFDGFNAMNAERIAAGEEPYKNPRNTASGSLKLQDSAEVARRPLECLLYSIVGENTNIQTQEQQSGTFPSYQNLVKS